MTYEEFLEKLRATPRDWRLALGRIRRLSPDLQCPISSVLGGQMFDGVAIGTKSGMDAEIAKKIMSSADSDKAYSWDTYFDPQIRADLLAACGLTEVKTDE